MIVENLQKLNTSDIYSMLLFILYKLNDIPGYRILSELIYILDKNSILKLCEYFGGKSIQIPTIYELEVLVYCMILYQDVKIDHNDFEESLKKLQLESHVKKDIRQKYSEIVDIMDQYEFIQR